MPISINPKGTPSQIRKDVILLPDLRCDCIEPHFKFIHSTLLVFSLNTISIISDVQHLLGCWLVSSLGLAAVVEPCSSFLPTSSRMSKNKARSDTSVATWWRSRRTHTLNWKYQPERLGTRVILREIYLHKRRGNGRWIGSKFEMRNSAF